MGRGYLSNGRGKMIGEGTPVAGKSFKKILYISCQAMKLSQNIADLIKLG